MNPAATPIRLATPADAAAIARVQVEGWQSTYRGIVADEVLDGMTVETRTPAWLENLQASQAMTFVAESPADGVVAFANCGPERTGRTDFDGELYALYVLSAWRRQGLGKQLFGQCADTLRASSKSKLLVWVLSANPYRPFYESLGGRLVDEQPIAIGSQTLLEVAYAWDDLKQI